MWSQRKANRVCKSRHVTSENSRERQLPGTWLRMALSVLYWVNYVEGHTKLTRKSEAAVESGRVLRFVVDELRVITACVQASMRDTSYKVQIFLDNEDTGVVKDATCQCPMGQYKCHHIAAALLFGYKRASKTDVKCSWLKHPKSAPPKSTVTMSDLYPPKQQEYNFTLDSF